jgi:hypothetical protein
VSTLPHPAMARIIARVSNIFLIITADLSFLDANRGEDPNKLWIKCIRRLILNHGVKLFIVVPIVSMNPK